MYIYTCVYIYIYIYICVAVALSARVACPASVQYTRLRNDSKHINTSNDNTTHLDKLMMIMITRLISINKY